MRHDPPSRASRLEETGVGLFEQEALTHLNALMAVGTRLTRNPTEAEDLVQDTFVKAMRARNQFEAGTNMRAWLLRILTNTFINRFRRGGLERSVLDGPDADPLADGWVGAASMKALRDPESQALRPMLEAEIRSALDELPDEFKLVVLLADVEELSYREISEVLGCPIGTVMSRLHRGRRLLKARLYEHALAFGIVDPEPEIGEPEIGEPASGKPASGRAAKAGDPIDLGAYRAKKGAAR